VCVCVCVCVCGVVGTSVVTVNVVIVSVVLAWSVSGRDSKCRDGQSHSWCTVHTAGNRCRVVARWQTGTVGDTSKVRKGDATVERATTYHAYDV
jgi:hypothetical protein